MPKKARTLKVVLEGLRGSSALQLGDDMDKGTKKDCNDPFLVQ